jgi:hypothetical protein
VWVGAKRDVILSRRGVFVGCIVPHRQQGIPHPDATNLGQWYFRIPSR